VICTGDKHKRFDVLLLLRISFTHMSTKTEDRQHVGTWIEPEVVRELEERAEQADRSRSAELRIAIRRYLERTRDHNDERSTT
jgi:Ribbon-helix-helix protein, copG family